MRPALGAIRAERFESPQEGDQVELETAPGEQGPQAADVARAG